MTGAGMSPAMGMGLVSVPAMAAMMLPSAVPAIARRARHGNGPAAAPLFAASYLCVWALITLAVTAVYRPPTAAVAGALIVAAGFYELTPLKRACRRRCQERVRSGTRFGVYCLGSSIGLMVVLIALNPMSLPLMGATAAVVLAQKVLAPHPALDVSLAVLIVVIGIAVATT